MNLLLLFYGNLYIHVHKVVARCAAYSKWARRSCWFGQDFFDFDSQGTLKVIQKPFQVQPGAGGSPTIYRYNMGKIDIVLFVSSSQVAWR